MMVRTVNGMVLPCWRGQLVRDAVKKECIKKPGHYTVDLGVLIVDFDLLDNGDAVARKISKKEDAQNG